MLIDTILNEGVAPAADIYDFTPLLPRLRAAPVYSRQGLCSGSG